MSRRKLVTYTKPLKRQKGNDDDIQREIESVQKGEYGTKLAALRYNVPWGIPQCYLKKDDTIEKR